MLTEELETVANKISYDCAGKIMNRITEIRSRSTERENQMLKDRIIELPNENKELQTQLIEKASQMDLLMTRVVEVDLIAFESDCNLKLLKAMEAKFAKERQQLLQQIKDLYNRVKSPEESKDCTSAKTASSPPVFSYSDVLKWSKNPSRRSTAGKPTQPSPVLTSNRFAELDVEKSVHQKSATTNDQQSSSRAKPASIRTGVHQLKLKMAN